MRSAAGGESKNEYEIMKMLTNIPKGYQDAMMGKNVSNPKGDLSIVDQTIVDVEKSSVILDLDGKEGYSTNANSALPSKFKRDDNNVSITPTWYVKSKAPPSFNSNEALLQNKQKMFDRQQKLK